jgi:hypothetical protein
LGGFGGYFLTSGRPETPSSLAGESLLCGASSSTPHGEGKGENRVSAGSQLTFEKKRLSCAGSTLYQGGCPGRERFYGQKGETCGTMRLAMIGILLSLFSALLLILSFPSFDIGFLSWIALVPLLLAVKNVSVKSGLVLPWRIATCFFLGVLSWVNYAKGLPCRPIL